MLIALSLMSQICDRCNTSHHIKQYNNISHHMTLYNIISCQVKSNHIISYHMISYHIRPHVIFNINRNLALLDIKQFRHQSLHVSFLPFPLLSFPLFSSLCSFPLPSSLSFHSNLIFPPLFSFPFLSFPFLSPLHFSFLLLILSYLVVLSSPEGEP